MDKKGYYKTLDVSENATEDDIRAKYKKLALKWHPDRWVNGTDEEKKTAEDNFKKINEAYSVLSDKEKRKTYDMGMDQNFQQGPGFNPFDIFKQHFGGMGFNFGDFFGNDFNQGFQNQQQRVQRGQDINVTVEITMEEANNGATKTVTYETHEKCEFCDGKGYGKDGGIETCPHCNGAGIIKQLHNMGFISVKSQTTCPYCGGTGKIVKNFCTHCGGTGLNSEKMRKEVVNVTIPVGVAHGEMITIPNRGDYPARGEGTRGNLNIIFHIKLPENYAFINNFGGIEYNMEVPFYDAMLGCERDVKFPNGKVKKIKVDKNTKSGTVYSYKNEGMRFRDGNARSSFDIFVSYTTPKSLTKKQEELLKEFKNITENGN